MRENQNVEWKQTWKDEYLRWICAFANTTGGVLYIGVDDNGKVVGINNASELVYMIPHKIKDYLGILVQTSIKRKKNKEYICIKVDAHPSPVSLRGRYYLRSGSNTYEAMGMELDRLMLKKLGIRWEKLSGHSSSNLDLDDYIIDYFKEKALESGKLSEREINVDNETLLKNLRLYNGKELSLAALLLFGKDPEEWVYNSFVKIGEVGEYGKLIRSDKVSGSIIMQVDNSIELLFSKYLNSDSVIPKDVVRELLINAIMHKAYDAQNPIEISVYKNKITIYNSSIFNQDITRENIYNSHPSIPTNPRIANAFYKCGLASLWGLGIEKVMNETRNSGITLPKFTINENSFLVRVNREKDNLKIIRKKLVKGSSDLDRDSLIKFLEDDTLLSDEDIELVLKKRRGKC